MIPNLRLPKEAGCAIEGSREGSHIVVVGFILDMATVGGAGGRAWLTGYLNMGPKPTLLRKNREEGGIALQF
jgi:hypothetical protein